jgi:uncharacterized protein involved in propanediol utilization
MLLQGVVNAREKLKSERILTYVATRKESSVQIQSKSKRSKRSSCFENKNKIEKKIPKFSGLKLDLQDQIERYKDLESSQEAKIAAVLSAAKKRFEEELKEKLEEQKVLFEGEMRKQKTKLQAEAREMVKNAVAPFQKQVADLKQEQKE